MNFSYVETFTKQNIRLFGFLIKNGSKKCIIYIPGLASNFFNSKIARAIGAASGEHRCDFLFAHNQGSFQVMDYPYLQDDGKLKSKIKGAAYENFEDCLYDIKAWLDFLKKENYEEIVIISHSLGCNKIIYYLSQCEIKEMTKLILLSPQDTVNFSNLDMHINMLEEAHKNIIEGNSQKILDQKFLGFCLMSSKTYYDQITNKNINNIPYKSVNADFSLLKKINIPFYIIIGSKDIGENGVEYMETLKQVCPTYKI